MLDNRRAPCYGSAHVGGPPRLRAPAHAVGIASGTGERSADTSASTGTVLRMHGGTRMTDDKLELSTHESARRAATLAAQEVLALPDRTLLQPFTVIAPTQITVVANLNLVGAGQEWDF